MKKCILLAVSMFFAAFVAKAQGGEEALPFMRIDRGANIAGMAGAGSLSTTSTAWSAFRNSAILPFNPRTMDVEVSYQNWAPKSVKTTNLGLGASYKISDKFGISFGGGYGTGEEYSVYNDNGAPSGTFKPTEMLFNAGLGFLISDGLSLGVNARYASQKLTSSDTYSGFAADVNVLYKVGALSASAGICNIGSSVKSSSDGSYSLPASFNVAAAYDIPVSSTDKIMVAADVDYFFKSGLTAALGAEYSLDSKVFVRGGFHYGSNEAIFPTFASLGAGFRFSGVGLSLAYLLGSDIGNTMTICLGYSF